MNMNTLHYDYLIIGGGIAGVTAAETIRGREAHKSIAILAAEPHMLYSRVLLPSYLKSKIPRERVFLRTREDFAKKAIDWHADTRAVRVDTAGRTVETHDGRIFGFTRLLIATGGTPRRWEHEHADMPLYRLQTIDDADRLHSAMKSIREPLVIGSSFIALEFIEIFLQNAITPQVLVRDDRFFGTFLDDEGGRMVEAALKDRGVACIFGDEVREIAARDGGHEVVSARGKRIGADALALGIGVNRSIAFLQSSGIALASRGIRTDEYLETSVPGIWAVGDAAEYFDPVAGAFHIAGNWSHALLQGTRAGLNMTGERAPYDSVPSYAISCLGMHMAAIGAPGGNDAITRADAAQARYGRFFFRDDIITGAFLINRAKDKPYFADLIARRARLATFEGDSVWKI